MAIRPRRIAHSIGVKPSLPVEIDRAHPLLRGSLVYLPMLEGAGSRSFFYSKNDFATLRSDSTADWVLTEQGHALQPNGLTAGSKRDGFYVYNNQVNPTGLTALTVFVQVKQGVAAPSKGAYILGGDDTDSKSGGRIFQLVRISSSNNIRAIVTPRWIAHDDVNYPPIATTDPFSLAFTWVSGGQRLLYFGKLGASIDQIASLPVATGSLSANSSSYIAAGANLTDNSVVLFAAVYGRALSAAEIRALHEDPYAPIRTRRVLMPVAAAGGSGALLDGLAPAEAAAAGSLTTKIPIAAAAVTVASASGGLATSIPLAANPAADAAASGALTTDIPLAGAGQADTTASGDITAQITFAGAPIADATASGTLAAASSQLGGTAQADATASGDLTATIRLTGQALTDALAAAGLTTDILMSGTASGDAAASGALTTGSDLGGQAAADATAIGDLTAQITLDGAVLAEALASGGMSGAAADLSGAAQAESVATGALLVPLELSGAAASASSATGALATIIKLNGAAASVSSATGGLTAQITFSGPSLAEAVANGTLTVTQGQLEGQAQADVTATGTLTAQIKLNAAAVAEAIAQASMTMTLPALTVGKWTARARMRRYLVRAVA